MDVQENKSLEKIDLLDKEKWGGLFSHDPAIYYDDSSDYYYIYSTDAGPNCDKPPGGQIRRTKDLIHMEYIGVALRDGIPIEVKEHTKATTVWAPDIIKVGKEYRMYYSCSTFGSRNSTISLATSTSPKGPFIHKGIVIKTTEESPVNAIDANIIRDVKTKDQYLVYGSFWGGICMIKLNEKTGFPVENGYGISIASRPQSVDGAIEGPYICYNPDTEYYYLFVSYESLSNYYNVRVGRSKNITGPYFDHNGISMTNHSYPPYEVGLKITTGYSFKKDTGWFGLGHNSVLNHNGNWFMVCHARYECKPTLHNINIRKMFWTKEGWPIVSPCLYTGEVLKEMNIEDLIGSYLRIDFINQVRDLVNSPTKMELFPDQSCSIHGNKGSWRIDGHHLTIKYVTKQKEIFKETYIAIPSKKTIALTGMNQNYNCIWGKKIL